MIYKPHNYQTYSKEYVIEHPKSGLFLDMGLGKTIITLSAIEELIYDRFEVDKVVILAPPNVARDTWPDEIEKWDHLKYLRVSMCLGNQKERIEGLQQEADIYIISNCLVDWLVNFMKVSKMRFDLLVIDELSAFKSASSNRFRALKKVAPTFKRIVGLTGTPAPNNLIDLWPQMYILDQGERLGKTITGYKNRYFYPEKYNGHIVYKWGLLQGSEESIYQAIGDVVISMKAKDYLQMPDRIDHVVEVEMGEKEKQNYKELKKEYCLELEGKDILAVNAAVLSGKLLQMASGAIYDIDQNVINIHDRKLEALDRILEEGKRLLVVYQYKHSLSRIIERYRGKLRLREYKCKKDKDDWNKSDIDILLIHPKACKYGLNLQEGGSTVVWFDMTWSLDDYLQTNARLWRQGQKETVVIHHMVCKGTIDEKVIKALEGKENSQEALIKAVKAEMR
ncbi:MAG: DEAD/DEAH box helicase [Eubacterium sp.]